MATQFFVVVCALAYFINILDACPTGLSNLAIGPSLASCGGCGPSLGAPVYASPLAAAASGGNLGVVCNSNLVPTGLSLLSQAEIQGYLDVAGAMPFLAAVAFDGTVPSSGQAAGAYSCGNGDVGLAADSLAAAGIAAGPGAASLAGASLGAGLLGAEIAGFNAGLSGARLGLSSCGCGRR